MNIETKCPQCGRDMTLPLPDDCDPEDGKRLAALFICDACYGPDVEPEPKRETRQPYRDE